MNSVAILLAAGAGRKFWPFSDVRNKCAFPIANTPVVLRLARQLREIGFTRLVVVVGVEEASVRAALRPLGEDGLLFVRQPGSQLGTTPATLAGLEASGALNEQSDALVVYGDVLYNGPGNSDTKRDANTLDH